VAARAILVPHSRSEETDLIIIKRPKLEQCSEPMIRSFHDWMLGINGEAHSDDPVRVSYGETEAGSACDIHASQG
jgi:hypothetical protein